MDHFYTNPCCIGGVDNDLVTGGKAGSSVLQLQFGSPTSSERLDVLIPAASETAAFLCPHLYPCKDQQDQPRQSTAPQSHLET